MRRRSRGSTAAAVAVVLLGTTLGAAAPTGAATIATLTPGASAYSAAAGTGTATLTARLRLSGSLGRLVDALISPIVDQALDPLLGALQGTANSVVTGALGSSSSLTASTSPTQPQQGTAPAAFPDDPLPAPCVASGAQPCYSGTPAAVSVPPLVSVGLGVLTGYVEQVSAAADATTPVFARATTASPRVSVLPGISTLIPGLPSVGNPLIAATLVSAKANCPNDGAVSAIKPKTAPSASVKASGISLLGGLIKLDVDSTSGRIANLVVNDVSYGSLLNLPTVSVAGLTISPYGNSVLVSIPLSLAQIIAGLGLGGSVAQTLTGLGVSSTLALKLVIGPNSVVTSRTASAWGLGIGVDLSGSLTFNLLDLVTASVLVPSGITSTNNGNLLDLRLAYATCQSGVVLPAVVPVIPPTLV